MPNFSVYESFANYRKASRYLYKADVAVQVEYYEDIPFWQSVFQYARPRKHTKFYYADMDGGKKQGGKGICKRYIPYADNALIVCVDSDFDCFLNPNEYSVVKYVLQTYTYSWENHYCYASSLQKQWAQCGIGSFDFEKFIDGLNAVIYLPLIKILAAKANRILGWHLLEFCGKILHPSVCKAGVLDNDGAGLLAAIQGEVTKWEKAQPSVSPKLVTQMISNAISIGLNQDTAYLYARGHCVYDLICNIGNKLSGSTIAFKVQVLDRALQMSGYCEIDKVVRETKIVM